MVHCALLVHRHVTSIAKEGGTTTGSNWIGNGERRQAGVSHEALNASIDHDEYAGRV
jgi:hypothetical protein